MPLDAICLDAVCQELRDTLIGCHIEKVYQPERDEVVLQTRGQGGARRLLLHVSANGARLHLIERARENPAAPPMFCMLLRKHIQGARLTDIVQPRAERIVRFVLDTTDELGVRCQKTLICELMGRHSNLILCDEQGRIVDALKRIDGDLSGKRQVLPGLFYRDPPAQDKHDPYTLSGVGLCAALETADAGQTLEQFLLGCVLGLSPLLCRELAFRAVGDLGKAVGALSVQDKAALSTVFDDFCTFLQQKKYQPYLLQRHDTDEAFDFTCLPITQYESAMQLTAAPSFSALLSTFYEKKSHAERMTRRSADLSRIVNTAHSRLARKLALQQKELADCTNRERAKQMGELITANLYQLHKGQSKVEVIDYYQQDCPTVTIALDLRLTPQQNAQRYFKQYQKAKTAERVLTEQIAHGKDELQYLESLLEALEEAESERDLAQLREEMRQSGLLSDKQSINKRHTGKHSAATPFQYKTSDGFAVFAGKNNLQNDLLTLKTALKNDIWLHTQKIHGSHVILVCDGRTPTEQALTEAAMIAAWHSKGRQSSLVPVDYTPVRYVKKPAGARPGMVIYTVYQTAFVTPEPSLIERLRVE